MNNRGVTKNPHTFEGGLQRDIAFSRFPQNAYFETNGFKLSATDEAGFYTIQNIEGSIKKFSITGVNITYMLEALDSLILFGYTRTQSIIYRISKTFIKNNSDIIIAKPTLTYYHNTSIGYGLIAKFATKHTEIPIAKYNYESDSIQKIYWKDSEFRHLNIIQSDKNNLESITEKLTLTYGDLITNKAQFEDYISGNLLNGTYFYTYQLYDVYGVETSFAPLMGPVYITNNFSKTDYKKIGLGKTGENSGYGVYGKISGINTSDYNRIRIVSVYYSSKNSTPIISIIEEKPIQSTVYFTDTGISLGNLSTDELIFRNVLLNPDTIESKDNILFLGSVDRKDYFDVDEWIIENDPDNKGLVTDSEGNTFWESRAFTFGRNIRFGGGVYTTDTGFITEISDADDSDNNKIELKYDGVLKYKVGSSYIPIYSNNLTAIPKNHDCVHPGIRNIKETDCIFRLNRSDSNLTSLRYKADFGLNPKKLLYTNFYYYGGIGLNIDYYYDTQTININGDDVNKNSVTGDILSPNTSNGLFNDFTNPNNVKKLAIPFDEVERYGIQFMEETTGRLSYVKWIGDLRSPEPLCFQTTPTGGDNVIVKTWNHIGEGGTNFTKVLYLVFTISNLPQGLKYRIVRVPKESESDYSNKAIGALMYPYHHLGNENLFNRDYLNYGNEYLKNTNGDVILGEIDRNTAFSTTRIATLISPDIVFTADKSYSHTYYGKLFGRLGYPIKKSTTVGAYTLTVAKYLDWNTYNYSELGVQLRDNSADPSIVSKEDLIKNITSLKYLKASDPSDSYMAGLLDIPVVDIYEYYEYLDNHNRKLESLNLNYNNHSFFMSNTSWSNDILTNSKKAINGSRLLIQSENTLNPIDLVYSDTDTPTHYTNPNDYGQILSLKEDNYNVRYGGSSYIDRSFNIYNPVTEFVNTSTVNVFGDHYVGTFEYLNGFLSEYGSNSIIYSSIFYFPTISRYNFLMSSMELFHKQLNKESGASINRHEVKGIYERDGVEVVQEEDYYEHNDAYDITNNFLEVALSKPFDFNSDKYNLEVISSNTKILREYTDSWLKFNNNKSIYLLSKLGNLTKLHSFKDRLYFFQEKGFGTLYVNERQNFTSNQESITIGKGGVLEGYQILSEDKGCSNKNLIVNSDMGIYWIDEMRKEFNIYNGQQVVNIGMKTGMASFFKDPDISFTNITYDSQSNEVIINYKGTSSTKGEDSQNGEYLLFYNEDYSQFTGMILARNCKFINLDNQLYLSYLSEFYKLSGGPRNRFLNRNINPSITFIDNPVKTQTYVLEGLELLLDVFNSNKEFQNLEASSIFTGIEITNNYEQADDMSGSDFVKTIRKFRLNNINVTVNPDRPDKLTDYFSKITITFNSIEGFKYVLHELNSYFNLTREI